MTVIILWFFLTSLWDGLKCVIVVFPDHTHLLFIYLFVGVRCWSLFWYALLYVLSSFEIILTRKRELVALLLLFFWMSCKCL